MSEIKLTIVYICTLTLSTYNFPYYMQQLHCNLLNLSKVHLTTVHLNAVNLKAVYLDTVHLIAVARTTTFMLVS